MNDLPLTLQHYGIMNNNNQKTPNRLTFLNSRNTKQYLLFAKDTTLLNQVQLNQLQLNQPQQKQSISKTIYNSANGKSSDLYRYGDKYKDFTFQSSDNVTSSLITSLKEIAGKLQNNEKRYVLLDIAIPHQQVAIKIKKTEDGYVFRLRNNAKDITKQQVLICTNELVDQSIIEFMKIGLKVDNSKNEVYGIMTVGSTFDKENQLSMVKLQHNSSNVKSEQQIFSLKYNMATKSDVSVLKTLDSSIAPYFIEQCRHRPKQTLKLLESNNTSNQQFLWNILTNKQILKELLSQEQHCGILQCILKHFSSTSNTGLDDHLSKLKPILNDILSDGEQNFAQKNLQMMLMVIIKIVTLYKDNQPKTPIITIDTYNLIKQILGTIVSKLNADGISQLDNLIKNKFSQEKSLILFLYSIIESTLSEKDDKKIEAAVELFIYLADKCAYFYANSMIYAGSPNKQNLFVTINKKLLEYSHTTTFKDTINRIYNHILVRPINPQLYILNQQGTWDIKQESEAQAIINGLHTSPKKTIEKILTPEAFRDIALKFPNLISSIMDKCFITPKKRSDFIILTYSQHADMTALMKNTQSLKAILTYATPIDCKFLFADMGLFDFDIPLESLNEYLGYAKKKGKLIFTENEIQKIVQKYTSEANAEGHIKSFVNYCCTVDGLSDKKMEQIESLLNQMLTSAHKNEKYSLYKLCLGCVMNATNLSRIKNNNRTFQSNLLRVNTYLTYDVFEHNNEIIPLQFMKQHMPHLSPQQIITILFDAVENQQKISINKLLNLNRYDVLALILKDICSKECIESPTSQQLIKDIFECLSAQSPKVDIAVAKKIINACSEHNLSLKQKFWQNDYKILWDAMQGFFGFYTISQQNEILSGYQDVLKDNSLFKTNYQTPLLEKFKAIKNSMNQKFENTILNKIHQGFNIFAQLVADASNTNEAFGDTSTYTNATLTARNTQFELQLKEYAEKIANSKDNIEALNKHFDTLAAYYNTGGFNKDAEIAKLKNAKDEQAISQIFIEIVQQLDTMEKEKKQKALMLRRLGVVNTYLQGSMSGFKSLFKDTAIQRMKLNAVDNLIDELEKQKNYTLAELNDLEEKITQKLQKNTKKLKLSDTANTKSLQIYNDTR